MPGRGPLSFEQQKPCWIEPHPPRLRLNADCLPKILGHIGLQMWQFAGLRRCVQSQIKRHLMRRFAGASSQQGNVFSLVRSNLKHNLMRADSEYGSIRRRQGWPSAIRNSMRQPR